MKNLFSILPRLKLDNKKIYLLMLASLVIIYLDFTFLINLQLRAIKNLTPKITKLKADIDAISKNIGGMENLKNSQIQARQKLLAKTKKIIPEEDIAWILQYVSELADKNNVKITQMKPVKEPQAKQEKVPLKSKLSPLLIILDLSCDYHALGRFINSLENAQTFFAVQDARIASEQDNYLKQKVNLTLRTYVKK